MKKGQQMESKQSKTLRRELALVRVETAAGSQDAALDVVGSSSARLLELAPTHVTAELVGEPDRITRFIDSLSALGTVKSLRTGAVVFE